MDRISVLEERLQKTVEKEKKQKEELSEQKEKLRKTKTQRRKVKSKLSVAKRQRDEKKKVLIGAYVLNQLEKGYKVEIVDYEDLIKQMDKFLVRDYERKRFNLAILNTEEIEDKSKKNE